METQIFEDIVHLLQGVDWLYNYPMTQVTFYAFEFLLDSQIGCVLSCLWAAIQFVFLLVT